MTKAQKFDLQVKEFKEKLTKDQVTISWLHKESIRIASEKMQLQPNKWSTMLNNMYTYKAIVELINEKRDED